MRIGSTEWCAMNMAKDNYAHNIPKEWITAKVWAVLLKNPVYADYVKKNSSFVNKILPSALLTKQKNVSKLPITNETTTNNSKGDKTMAKKNSNETTTLNTTEITANIAQLTDVVNKMLARLNALEAKNVAPKQFKKLRETAEEVKKNVKKVKKVVKVKKNPVIVNLQKKAMAMKETMTKAQLAAYEKMWSKKWSMVNKSIDKNKKEERSMAFAKGRIECAKNAIKMF